MTENLPLNVNWINAETDKPSTDRVVLALAPSGYNTYPWMIFFASYDSSYKGWVNIQNTRITDSCADDVKFWTEID